MFTGAWPWSRPGEPTIRASHRASNAYHQSPQMTDGRSNPHHQRAQRLDSLARAAVCTTPAFTLVVTILAVGNVTVACLPVEMAHWVQFWLCKCGDLNLGPSTSVKTENL